MIVLWKNGFYQLEMPYLLFESWKRTEPNREVEILELTASNYKELKKVEVREVEDWSIVRNLQALGR
jgi:hypothetical protein